MSDLRLFSLNETANFVHDRGGDLQSPRGREWRVHDPAQSGMARVTLGQPARGAVDHIQRRLVARLGTVSPGEHTVRFKDHTLGFGVLVHEVAQAQREFKAGPEPGEPPYFIAIDLPRHPLAIR